MPNPGPKELWNEGGALLVVALQIRERFPPAQRIARPKPGRVTLPNCHTITDSAPATPGRTVTLNLSAFKALRTTCLTSHHMGTTLSQTCSCMARAPRSPAQPPHAQLVPAPSPLTRCSRFSVTVFGLGAAAAQQITRPNASKMQRD